MRSKCWIRSAATCSWGLGLLCLSGCYTTTGDFVPRAQFVYPNSNVEILGPVSGEAVKWGPFWSAEIGLKEMKAAYNQALRAQAGANLIVNYQESTRQTYWIILLLHKAKYRIQGYAARMEVGEKPLR